MVLLVSQEVLAKPPSQEDGVTAETEEQLRNFGAGLIQGAGLLLRLPQLTVASAAALFQRFYFRRSFAEFEVRAVAGASLALACKLEETHRTLKDVIIVVHRLQMRALQEEGEPAYAGRPAPTLDAASKEFGEAKQEALRAERSILRELGFDVTTFLDPPHKYVLQYMNALKFPNTLLQKAWSYLNDALRTKLCCTHQPDHIALASLFLASRALGVKLPEKPPWWEAFNVQVQSLKDIAQAIAALYGKPPGEHVAVPRRKSNPATVECPAKSPADEDPGEPPAGDADGPGAGAARQDGNGQPDAAPPPLLAMPPAVMQPAVAATAGFGAELDKEEERRRAALKNGGAKEKERQRDRRKEKDREKEKDRDRDRERDREKEKEKERDKDRDRECKREKERHHRDRRKGRGSSTSSRSRSSSDRGRSRSRSRSRSRRAGKPARKAGRPKERRARRSASSSSGS